MIARKGEQILKFMGCVKLKIIGKRYKMPIM
jgi:hypothetical protein